MPTPFWQQPAAPERLHDDDADRPARGAVGRGGGALPPDASTRRAARRSPSSSSAASWSARRSTRACACCRRRWSRISCSTRSPTCASWWMSGSPQAATVLDSLIAYLRAAVPRLHEPATTMEQELQLVRAYLELMHMRMPDRLQFDVQVDAAALKLRCPPTTLLTLVENAVRHGIDPSEEGGRIEVRVRVQDGRCRAEVTDTGVGLQGGGEGLGTGLSTLRERLQLVFGGDAQAATRRARAARRARRAGLPGAGEPGMTAPASDGADRRRRAAAAQGAGAHARRGLAGARRGGAGAQRPRGGRAVRGAASPTSAFSTCTCRACRAWRRRARSAAAPTSCSSPPTTSTRSRPSSSGRSTTW